MNKIRLVLISTKLLILSACGQYGDLYAPPAETEQQAAIESADNTAQEQELDSAKQEKAE